MVPVVIFTLLLRGKNGSENSINQNKTEMKKIAIPSLFLCLAEKFIH